MIRSITLITILFVAISCAGPRMIFHPEELPSHMRWVMVEDIPIVYTDQGQGDPILIFSSYPLRIESWSELARLLSHSSRVIVIETPWLTEPTAMKGDFSSERVLQIYRKFARTLGIERTHVMGMGEGGGLAIAFGHHFPEHIGSAISINGFEGVSWSGETRKMLDRFYPPVESGNTDLLSAASLRYRQKVLLPEEKGRLLESLEIKERLKAVQTRKAHLGDDIKSLYTLAMIEYIHFPVLMIRSEKDSLLPEEYAEWARKRIQGVEYSTLSDAGHFAFIDQPEKVAELVRNFLLSHPIPVQ